LRIAFDIHFHFRYRLRRAGAEDAPMTPILDGFAFYAIVFFLGCMGLVASIVIFASLFGLGARLFGFREPPR
jgi:hypothetical protein